MCEFHVCCGLGRNGGEEYERVSKGSEKVGEGISVKFIYATCEGDGFVICDKGGVVFLVY